MRDTNTDANVCMYMHIECRNSVSGLIIEVKAKASVAALMLSLDMYMDYIHKHTHTH